MFTDKAFILLIGLVFAACAGKQKTEHRKIVLSEWEKKMNFPHSTGSNDTLLNGSVFHSKVFLTRDSLYRMARDNGIVNYRTIRFAHGVGAKDRPYRYKNAEDYVGDTAMISFKAYKPGILPGEVATYEYIVSIGVDFSPDHGGIDSTFTSLNRLYLIGQ